MSKQTVVKLKKCGRITIPEYVREAENLNENDLLMVTVEKITIKKSGSNEAPSS